MDLLDGDVELTEFEAIDAQSVKGVRHGANGFPFLLVKGVALPDADASKAAGGDAKGDEAEKSALGIAVKAVTGGVIDQGPDISLGHQIMGLLAQAIEGEAQEIGAGSYGETCDVDLLNCAASMIARWLGREAPPGDDGTEMGMLMASAAIKAAESAKTQNDLPDSAFAYIEPGGEKDPGGKTTPRSKRHFPVHDKAHADNAAARIAQGAEFGDKAKAKVEAAQREFGEKDDAAKARIAPGGTDVDTVAQGTGNLAKVVEAAVTKATASLRDDLTAVRDELAKVKATPVPGGPVLSRNVQVKTSQGAASEDWAAKAAYYRDMAEQVTDRTTADGYRKLARDADAKAVTPPAT